MAVHRVYSLFSCLFLYISLAYGQQVCSKFSIHYSQCENLDQNLQTCHQYPRRNYTAILDFASGAGLSTVFTISNQIFWNHGSDYAFNTTIKFSSGKPSQAKKYNNYVPCQGDTKSCTATLPALSNIFFDIAGEKGLEAYDQYPLSFYNGQALMLSNEGDFVYWDMVNNENMSHCLQSTVIQNPSIELYSELTYCCIETKTLTPDDQPVQETCASFDVTINLLDSNKNSISNVAFAMDTNFDFYSENGDTRTIRSPSAYPPHDGNDTAYIEVNAEQECPMTLITDTCYPNTQNKYYTILDYNYSNKIKNVSLYSSTAIFLTKFNHIYYKPDGTPFAKTSDSWNNTVTAYDGFGLGHDGIAEAQITCKSWVPTTPAPTVPTTTKQVTTPQPQTTTQYIDFDYPSTQICTELVIHYIECNYSTTLNKCVSLKRYWSAILDFESAANASTKFTVTQKEHFGTPFTPYIRFYIADDNPAHLFKFNKYVDCSFNSNNVCTAIVPQLSTLFLFVNDSTGSHYYYQQGGVPSLQRLSFWNGNALTLDAQGSYVNAIQNFTFMDSQNCMYPFAKANNNTGLHTEVTFCCGNGGTVPKPPVTSQETCQSFNAKIEFIKNKNSIAWVEFDIDTTFDWANTELDYRMVTIKSYNNTINASAQSQLIINNEHTCPLTPITSQCLENNPQQTSYFLQFDYNFNLPNQSIGYYTSAALSLYKYWHLYYKHDGGLFSSDGGNQCDSQLTAPLDYYGTQLSDIEVYSQVCCNKFVPLPPRPTTPQPTTTTPGPTTTTTRGPTTNYIDQNAPESPICSSFVVYYVECDNYAKNKKCDPLDILHTQRKFTFSVTFQPGANQSTVFNVIIEDPPVPNNFTPTIKFVIGNPKYAMDSNDFIACQFTGKTCQVQVPYVSTLILSINDSTGVKTYNQDGLSFFNGNAISLGDDTVGNYATGDYNYMFSSCLNPQAEPLGSNNVQITYCCNQASQVQYPQTYMAKTCKAFNASITLYSATNDQIASVNFVVDSTFELTNSVMDRRDITVGTYTLKDSTADSFLEINFNDAECKLSNSMTKHCDKSQNNAYFLNLDLNYHSKVDNEALFSSSAISLYKYWHVYFRSDGGVFDNSTQGEKCYDRTVDAYGYNDSTSTGSYGKSSICCTEFSILPIIVTPKPTTPQPTTTKPTTIAPTTTIAPPNTNMTCNKFNVSYFMCYNMYGDVQSCLNLTSRRFDAVLEFTPGPEKSTVFTFSQINHWYDTNDTVYNFTYTIQFSSGDPSEAKSFNQYISCNFSNPSDLSTCTATVPDLSTIWITFTGADGSNTYPINSLSFYNGMPLYLSNAGDYVYWGMDNSVGLSNCLQPAVLQNNTIQMYNQLSFCCMADQPISTPAPADPNQTCQLFDAYINLYDETNTLVSSVNFTLDTDFELWTMNDDLRTINVQSYWPNHDMSHSSWLQVNAEQECPLSNITTQCYPKMPNRYYTILDLIYSDVSKQIKLYSSSAIFLNKRQHVYEGPDGARIDSTNKCVQNNVTAYDFTGMKKNGYATSQICCKNNVSATYVPTPSPTTVSTTSPTPGPTTTYVDQNQPDTQTCSQFRVRYMECSDFRVDDNECSAPLDRFYDFSLSYAPGPNLSTVFTVIQSGKPVGKDPYNVTIKFSNGKGDYAEHFNDYIECSFIGQSCQVTVPYISTMFVFVSDVDKPYFQYDLIFFNGQAISIENDHVVNYAMGNLSNDIMWPFKQKDCMKPLTQTNGNMHSQLWVCCDEKTMVKYPEAYEAQTCQSFDGYINLFDSANSPLASVNFTLETGLELWNSVMDTRTITINSFDLSGLNDPNANGALEVNFNDENCRLSSLNKGHPCQTSQSTSYFLNLDLNVESSSNTLYTYGSIPLYKYWHAFFRPDGSMFDANDKCYTNQVAAFDYNGGATKGAYATSKICCTNVVPLPMHVTPRPTTTSRKTQAPVTQPPTTTKNVVPVTQQTSGWIDNIPPLTDTCSKFLLKYVACDNFMPDTNQCPLDILDGGLLSYISYSITYQPGLDQSTVFTIVQETGPSPSDGTFNTSIKFSIGNPDNSNAFNNWVECTFEQRTCTVQVSGVSTLFLTVTDASGSVDYKQDGLSFYNGNAISMGMDMMGNYAMDNQSYAVFPFMHKCLPASTSSLGNGIHAQVAYCCEDSGSVEMPYGYNLQTCKSFDASIFLYEYNNQPLASVDFTISTFFELDNAVYDSRNIVVNSYNLLNGTDPQALGTLEINFNNRECRLSSTMNKNCDHNQETAYFLNLDFDFNSPSRSLHLTSSSAISLYKYWHVYFRPGGGSYANVTGDMCDTRSQVQVWDYSGSGSKTPYYATSSICCTEFETLPILFIPPATTQSPVITTPTRGPSVTQTSAQTQTPGSNTNPATQTSMATNPSGEPATVNTTVGTGTTAQTTEEPHPPKSSMNIRSDMMVIIMTSLLSLVFVFAKF